MSGLLSLSMLRMYSTTLLQLYVLASINTFCPSIPWFSLNVSFDKSNPFFFKRQEQMSSNPLLQASTKAVSPNSLSAFKFNLYFGAVRIFLATSAFASIRALIRRLLLSLSSRSIAKSEFKIFSKVSKSFSS